jgi:hypothetical protein
MDRPSIATAIPKRRYQVGDFSASLLGEIETHDPVQYRFILAMVPAGQPQPTLYVTCEKNRRSEPSGDSYRIRVVAEGFNEVLGSCARWADEETFAAEALSTALKVLSLSDEEPIRLL